MSNIYFSKIYQTFGKRKYGFSCSLNTRPQDLNTDFNLKDYLFVAVKLGTNPEPQILILYMVLD